MKFLKPNDSLLTKSAQEIPVSKILSEETKQIIQTMLKVANGQQRDKRKPVMVGLAAPQIGISKRIILVDVKANGKGLPATPRKLGLRGGRGEVGDLRFYINPQITWTSKKVGEWYEGCYSTSNVCGIVKRATSIKVSGFTMQLQTWVNHPTKLQAKYAEEKYSGYVARIFQHEIDHLNGKRFPDLIKDPEKLHWVEKSEFPLYRNKQAWRNWPRKCSFEKWEKIRKTSS